MENLLSELRFDPLDYVAHLESPIGVYLLKKVFDKEPKEALRKKLYEKTIADQSADGSWHQLFVQTANSLWDLCLLGFGAEDPSVKKGLDWLRSIQKYEYHGFPGFFYSGNRKDPSLMRSILYGEFGPGCSNFYQTTYAVHLFHLFGFDYDPQVKTTIDSYLKIWGDKGKYCGIWCTLNVFRILLEHPLSRESKQVEIGLKVLAEKQTKIGGWKEGHQQYPFYHTFQALSRSKHPLAKQQLEKAFPSIIKRQNKDGSWGEKAQETKTYLLLDALKNIYIIHESFA